MRKVHSVNRTNARAMKREGKKGFRAMMPKVRVIYAQHSSLNITKRKSFKIISIDFSFHGILK